MVNVRVQRKAKDLVSKMCGFKFRVSGKDFIPAKKDNIPNIPKSYLEPYDKNRKFGFDKQDISKSINVKRGPMEHAGGMTNFMSMDMSRMETPNPFKNKGKGFSRHSHSAAKNTWDAMDMAGKVESASNTGMDMSGFVGKNKHGGASAKPFSKLKHSNKKALGKYFGVI